MNTRIEELAEQAGLEFDDDSGLEPDPFYYTTQKDLEKFAELIVRECIDICKEQEYKYRRSSEEVHWTPIDSANAIEKHFGVE